MPGDFYVSGGLIYGPTDQIFTPFGANVGTQGSFDWWGDALGQSTSAQNDWGWNCIRLNLYTDDLFAAPGTATTRAQAIIDEYTAKGIVVMLGSGWNITGVGPGYNNPLTVANNPQPLAWMQSMAAANTANKYVWFNVYNEPVADTTDWVNLQVACINGIRSQFNNNIIVCDAPGAAADASWSGSQRLYSGMGQSVMASANANSRVVFSQHNYAGYDTAASEGAYLDSMQAAGLAVIIGEYGYFDPNTNQNYKDCAIANLAAAPPRHAGLLVWHGTMGDGFALRTNSEPFYGTAPRTDMGTRVQAAKPSVSVGTSFTETFNIDHPGWNTNLVWTQTGAGQAYTLFSQATSNTAAGVSGVEADGFVPAAHASSQNCEVRVTATQMELSGNSVVGVAARSSAFGNGQSYQFVRVGNANLNSFSWVLRKRVSGGPVQTLVGPTVLARASTNSQEVLKLQVLSTLFGQLLTAYIDGVQVASYMDSTDMIASGDLGGLLIRSNVAANTYADNWNFGDIGTTGGAVSFTGKISESSSAKATKQTLTHRLVTKPSTASSMKARFASKIPFAAKLPTSSGLLGVFGTPVEGFLVKRRFIAKVPTSSKVAPNLETGRATRAFAGKISISSSAKTPLSRRLTFSVKVPTAGRSHGLSATATRDASLATKAFTSDSATAYMSGGQTRFQVTIAITSSSTGSFAGGHSHFAGSISIASEAYAVEFGPPEFVAIFVCPAALENPPTLPEYHPGNRLFRHYRSRPVGHNVFIYSNNTVSEQEPDGTTTLWRESDRMGDTMPNAPHVVKVFWGGHEAELITIQQRSLLVAAGYTVGEVPM